MLQHSKEITHTPRCDRCAFVIGSKEKGLEIFRALVYGGGGGDLNLPHQHHFLFFTAALKAAPALKLGTVEAAI